jgi:hypothetical protein
VPEVRIRTHGGNDIITRSAVDKLMSVWGGGENDTLTATGGNGGIRFRGEAGNDLLIVDGMSNNAEVSFWGEGGNDIFKVRNATRDDNGNAWNFIAGGSTDVFDQFGVLDRNASANWLMVESGNSYVQSDGVGGWLDTKVTGTASLLAKNLRQNRVLIGDVGDTAKLTIKPDGSHLGTSILDSLYIGATAQFDLTDNDLILRTTADTKNAVYEELKLATMSGWNGVDANFVTNWNGPGVVSSSARTTNVAAGIDLVGIGMIRNSDLDIATGVPGSAYTSFSGQNVTYDYVLLKFTYTGDTNLDGAVTFDDYAPMDSAYFGLIPNLGWATGDINYDNVISFDDYGAVDQAFFFQGDPL